MAYTLNTGHALYANLVELIGVQAGALVSHKTARTFTKHAEASYGSGTWGEHFVSLNGGYTAKGASFTPSIALASNAYPNQTVVVVVNATGASSGGRFLARAVGGARIHAPGKAATGELIGYRAGDVGTTIGTGNKMLTAVRIGETAFKLYNDKVLDYNGTGLAPDYADASTAADYLCGWDGQNAIAASLVWLAVFDRELTAGEISDLYDSLGASNAFGLVSAGGTNGDALGGTGTSTGSGTGGTATGVTAGSGSALGGTGTSTGSGTGGTASTVGAGSFTTDAMENNTGAGLLASTSVVWTWYQGAIGAAPTITTHGTGTTNASGVLTATALPTGAGFLLVRTTDSAGVYYQPGTVT